MQVSAPQPPHPWRRNLGLLSASIVVVALLFHFDILDTRQIATAFREHAGLLALNVLCLCALSIIGVVRHRWVLSVVGVQTTWGRVTAANFVSQAVGQWAPGSLAVSEMLRLGLMLGATREQPEAASRIAVASIVDRLVGLGVTFCLGALAGAYLSFHSPAGAPTELLLGVSIASLLFGTLLISLPLAGSETRFAPISRRLHDPGGGFVASVRRRLAGALDQIGRASAHWRGRPGALAATVAMSGLAALLNPLSGYLTSLAVADEVPFLLLTAVLPLTIAGVLLPIGFAGFGGPQLVAVALFAPFGVAAKTIVALTIVQNTLVLGVQTVLGALAACAYGPQLSSLVRASFKRR